MSLESDVQTALAALVSNRSYPDVAPNNVTAPYVVWQQVGGSAFSFLESAAVGKRNARIQVACWAATRLAASALSRTAEDALVTNTTLRATPLGAMVSDFDEDTRLYGSRQDFSIFY
jgi:hypothetical protein